MYDTIGINNTKVFPKITARAHSLNAFQEEKLTVSEELALLSKPVKALMNEQKFSYLTRDPENSSGHNILRDKYKLP